METKVVETVTRLCAMIGHVEHANMRMISMLTAMARGLPSTDDSIATPCSVKA